MRKRLSFWTITAIALGVWLSIIWIAQARQGNDPLPRVMRQPLQQVCNDTHADLRIQQIEIRSRGIDQPFDVLVHIQNGSTGNQGLADTWSHLFVDRPPSGAPDVQAFAQTSQLTDTGKTISANFTVTSGHATVGWHTISVVIDATDAVQNEGCNGDRNGNNQGATSFEITGVPTQTPTQTPTRTATVPVTATPFRPPEIYLFTPEQATIGRGDSVTLRWQVSGEAVSVTLDGEPVPMEASIAKYPTESHVYTLRAENPGGVVQEISQITVADPTITPTPTEGPCDYPTVHEFGASPSSVIRGSKVTVYWDIEGAVSVFLNGAPVPDVSAREFKIDRTTTFVLVARNACGEVSEELTVQASYATATPTFTPTQTSTPTRTSTPTPTPWVTSTPVNTPTRNVLPTHTGTPVSSGGGTQTATPTMTGTFSAFESPIGTPTATVYTTSTVVSTDDITATETVTVTATWTPTSTFTPSPTWTATVLPTQTDTATPTETPTAIQATQTVVAVGPAEGTASMQTPDVGPSGPILSPTAIPPTGRIRMYLCPLAVLLLFAIGVVILSIVVPRIQERQQDMDDFGYSAALYGVASADGDGSGPLQEKLSSPSSGLVDAERLPGEPPSQSSLDDEPMLEDIPFSPNGPLLDEERSPQRVLFDPLLDDLGPSERSEAERAPSTSEEKP